MGTAVFAQAPRRMERRAAGLLALALLSVACGAEPRPSNLLLISVDALRPDRLGYAGHFRSTSPAIDALAAESIVFENAYSASGWTLPSLATLLSGLSPRDHGATGFTHSLDRRVEPLSGWLADRGYDTRAYVSHVLLHPRFGLARGFDIYDDSVLDVGDPHEVSTAVALTDRVVADLEREPVDGPFFLWVHYFDPHFAYLAHPGFREFGDAPVDRYDSEIAVTDRELARLLAELEQRALLRDTVIVFAADHGEEFSDHGGGLHDTLYEEVIRIPLILRVPGRAAAVRAEPVQQIDVVPTVLSALGIEAPPGLQGRDLLSDPSDEIPIFFERDVPSQFRQRAVRLGNAKLIVVESVPPEHRRPGPPEPRPQPGLRRGVSLYDLAADPDETVDRSQRDPQTVAVLMALLRSRFSGDRATRPASALDPELESQLRALGYLASPGEPAEEAR